MLTVVVALGVLTKSEAANHPFRNVVTRALGGRDPIKADLTCEKLQSGDLVLLCSDGLNSMLTDDTIREIVLGADLRRLLARDRSDGRADDG